jgi:hypothetical protein
MDVAVAVAVGSALVWKNYHMATGKRISDLLLLRRRNWKQKKERFEIACQRLLERKRCFAGFLVGCEILKKKTESRDGEQKTARENRGME